MIDIPLNDIIHLFIAIGGLTYIVTVSKLFQEFRELLSTIRSKTGWFLMNKIEQLFECPLCFGFWSTLICLCLYHYCGLIGQLILFCFEGAIISLFIYSIIKYFKDI